MSTVYNLALETLIEQHREAVYNPHSKFKNMSDFEIGKEAYLINNKQSKLSSSQRQRILYEYKRRGLK